MVGELGGMVTVPWTQNSVRISGLQPGAEYDITVSTSITAGSSGTIIITAAVASTTPI